LKFDLGGRSGVLGLTRLVVDFLKENDPDEESVWWPTITHFDAKAGLSGQFALEAGRKLQASGQIDRALTALENAIWWEYFWSGKFHHEAAELHQELLLI